MRQNNDQNNNNRCNRFLSAFSSFEQKNWFTKFVALTFFGVISFAADTRQNTLAAQIHWTSRTRNKAILHGVISLLLSIMTGFSILIGEESDERVPDGVSFSSGFLASLLLIGLYSKITQKLVDCCCGNPTSLIIPDSNYGTFSEEQRERILDQVIANSDNADLAIRVLEGANVNNFNLTEEQLSQVGIAIQSEALSLHNQAENNNDNDVADTDEESDASESSVNSR